MQSTVNMSVAERIKVLCSDTYSLAPSLLVSATYDGEKRAAVLKFYNPDDGMIHVWYDKTGHKPYCFAMDEQAIDSIRDRKDILAIERVKKVDLLNDKEVDMLKIVATDPLAIGGTEKSVRNMLRTWESDIKYYENYLYDNGLIVGLYYSIEDGVLKRHEYKVAESVDLALKKLIWDSIASDKTSSEELRSYLQEWAKLLNQPIPEIKRVALDIEVVSEDDRIPDANRARNEVIAVAMVGSDDRHEVFLLNRKGNSIGNKDALDANVNVRFFDDERELLRSVFSRMLDYPFIITFNGDEFDLPYLYNRALNLGIARDEIPITLQRDSAAVKHGVHIDLYRTFTNRSIQIYAFSHKYSEYTLNAISEALINESKIKFEGSIGDLPLYELANYCYNDARITYRLTVFSNNLLMKLLIAVARIAKMPIEDLSRLGVSQWIRSMLYFEHRRRNALIPRKEELEQKGYASTTAVIKDKKYRGGFVVEPKPGVHFNVVVLDFASLYPSIIKVYNLSYETVRCVHEECKVNMIPETEHWVCKKRKGITSLLIGSLRDLRVNYYKQLSKDKTLKPEDKELYSVISQALKVILNASYGVMGADIFPLYCLPVAEATAAIGRYIITSTIRKCHELGIEVIYGDTDSLFLKGPSREQIESIAKWARKELGVDLDLDKQYRYIALSERKKNYLGVLIDGNVDVKGLTGKKSHTPQFVRDAFYAVVDILSKVNTEQDFEYAREEIRRIIKDYASRLKSRKIPLEDLAFNVMVGKAPEDYKKTIPQHIRAAQLLQEHGKREVKAGDIISFVKTTTPPGVKPVELARVDEVDVDKYIEYMRTTFDQILGALGYEFDVILGASKLEDFFFMDK
ncbi:MAG: DNA-directed DNA polymerase I [Candidatus Nitrosocaldus sp.]